MFEEVEGALNQINPDSMNPHDANPTGYNSEFKSMTSKSPDYHDSPEYRKSLHLQGPEKEEVLRNLRTKLGMQGPSQGMSSLVKKHHGADSMKRNFQGVKETVSGVQYGFSTDAPKYDEPRQEYQETKYEEPKSEGLINTKASSETPKYESPKYAEGTVEPKYEQAEN